MFFSEIDVMKVNFSLNELILMLTIQNVVLDGWFCKKI